MPASGSGKGKKSRGGKDKSKSGRTTKAKRAGLEFSVARVQRQMRQKKYSERVSVMAAVVLAATLEVEFEYHSVTNFRLCFPCF